MKCNHRIQSPKGIIMSNAEYGCQNKLDAINFIKRTYNGKAITLYEL